RRLADSRSALRARTHYLGGLPRRPALGRLRVLAGRGLQRAQRYCGGGYGIAPETIYSALVTFKSVKRRLEVKAEVNGITIIDDFAHHPTAIAGTLRALRTVYPGRRLWVVLEPRSNTLRRRILQS